MLWAKLIKKIIKILNSDVSPKQIAGGVALGSIIGFTPFGSLHNLVVLFLIFVLKVNITSAFVSIAVFGLIGFMTDPLAHKIGYYLLVEQDGLTPAWTYLYNLPIVPFTRFNNTVVLGSLLISLILFVPVFIFSSRFVVVYRTKLQSKVQNMKIIKWFKLSKIYKIYDSYK